MLSQNARITIKHMYIYIYIERERERERHTRKKVSGPPFNNTTSRPQQRPIKTTRKHTTTHN